MNKLTILSMVVSAVMFTSTSAFASSNDRYDPHHESQPALTLNLGSANGNYASSNANTGMNVQNGTNTTGANSGSAGFLSGPNAHATGNQTQVMFTGNAEAYTGQTNMVNSGSCGCGQNANHQGYNINIGSANHNAAVSNANSGMNAQNGTNTTGANSGSMGFVSGSNANAHGNQMQVMGTGHAWATTDQWNLVNSSVTPSN